MAITPGIQASHDPLRSAVRPDSKVDANDFRHFAALRKSAREDDPAALREVARQFESIFTKMMLDSMRKASFGDPIFGSDQADMYQSMMDDQLAVEMSQGEGLGLADLLIRQLGHGDALAAQGELGVPGSGKPFPASDEAKQQFIEKLLPKAEVAGRELGVDPRAIIAQAALETGWGTAQPADATGDSHNLFGIKAGGSWRGNSVTADTREFTEGVEGTERAHFRAYASAEASIDDYVSLLRDNPRYAGALNTGSDVRAFATALQRGGYATDPNYANKLVGIVDQLAERTPAQSGARQPLAASLKPDHATPLTGKS